MTGLRVLACAFTCCPPGTPGFAGGESQLGWNLLKQIGRFHEVWAITQSEDRPSLESALQEHGIANIQFCYVGLPQWMRPLMRIQGGHQIYYHIWQLKAYFAAKKLHQQVSFELFHHITYANDWLASFIGACLPIPYIRGPGGGAHRTPKGLGTEYPLSGRFWELVRSIGQWVLRHDPLFTRGQRRASAILVCNRESVSKIPDKWSHKVHLFPVSGVSAEDFVVADPTPSTPGQFRVVSAGTLIRVKGFGLAIRAFKEFADKHSEATFTIIGGGPEEPRLRRLVDRLQLQDKVQMLGAKPHSELISEMASSDVFLFPSLRDGGGTVVVEAMSVGKPVVCLDTGGPGLHITEECGLKITPCCPPHAVSQLADSLERLYLDEELRIKLGEAGRQRAKQLYHWDRLGERLMEIYQHALDTSGSG